MSVSNRIDNGLYLKRNNNNRQTIREEHPEHRSLFGLGEIKYHSDIRYVGKTQFRGKNLRKFNGTQLYKLGESFCQIGK